MPDWSLTIARHGAEDQAVVIIDGFAADPKVFLEDAEYLAFRRIGDHYPGVRATVAPALLRLLIDALGPIAADVFGAHDLSVVDAFYSLMTVPPAALAPIQRLPHFDELSPTRLALLHYLARDEGSGTAFFRQRSTGFETVDAVRLPAYRAALEADCRRHGLPDPAYIAGDTPMFEQLALHRGLFNRAILYRSHGLHCAAIPPGTPLSADPRTGRLTVNTFLDSRIEGAGY